MKTINQTKEFSITSCSASAREKFKLLQDGIDKILILQEDRPHVLTAFSFLINPTIVDSFESHADRMDYYKGREFTPEWDEHYKNRLRKNNITRALWFIANQHVVFTHCNRDLQERAKMAIEELLPRYDHMDISKKKAVIALVDALISEFIYFHCKEAVLL